MMLSPIIEGLAEDLEQAAALGDESVQQAARLLATALGPSVKLRLLEALEQAAGELAGGVPGATVDVRLRDGDPVLSMTLAEELAAPSVPDRTPGVDDEHGGGDEGEVVRITLRLPERLKSQVERAAQSDGLSVNTWLVEAAALALRRTQPAPGAAAGAWAAFGGPGRRGGPRRVTGFVRG